MQSQWAFRPYVARIYLAVALLLLSMAEADVIFVYVRELRFHPSFGFGLYVFTVTIILLVFGIGVSQGYRAIRRLQSLPNVGNKISWKICTVITAMAGAGGIAVIVSVTQMVELLSQK